MEMRCFTAASHVTVSRTDAEGRTVREDYHGGDLIKRVKRPQRPEQLRRKIQLKNWPDYRAQRQPPPQPDDGEPGGANEDDERRSPGDGDGNPLNFDVGRSAEGLWDGATGHLRQMPSLPHVMNGATAQLQQRLKMAGPGQALGMRNVGRNIQAGVQAAKVPRPVVY